jgi:hypothetical protein
MSQVAAAPATVDFHQVNQARGTRAFRPVFIGNLVVSFWAQRYSIEKIQRFCSVSGVPFPGTTELFGVSLFERNNVMGREVTQAIDYTTDPRFCHFNWAQFRARAGHSFPECFTADGLRMIVADLMNYMRPRVESGDAMVQDIAAQLEAALSLL